MLTLEEINRKAKYASLKMFVVWFVFFGIVFPLLMPLLAMVISGTKFDAGDFADYIMNVIVWCFGTALVSGMLMAALVSYNTRKKLKEENAEEERLRREEHYNIMEGKGVADELEKLAKLKESGILTEEEFKVQKEKLLNN